MLKRDTWMTLSCWAGPDSMDPEPEMESSSLLALFNDLVFLLSCRGLWEEESNLFCFFPSLQIAAKNAIYVLEYD
ncbi:hypothetical protein K1719_047027 [Acacia pycnantha]|nr:hypothetical protein K1719_047027 [Acacia pycnantha]